MRIKYALDPLLVWLAERFIEVIIRKIFGRLLDALWRFFSKKILEVFSKLPAEKIAHLGYMQSVYWATVFPLFLVLMGTGSLASVFLPDYLRYSDYFLSLGVLSISSIPISTLAASEYRRGPDMKHRALPLMTLLMIALSLLLGIMSVMSMSAKGVTWGNAAIAGMVLIQANAVYSLIVTKILRRIPQ
jgi:hypothetical protein